MRREVIRICNLMHVPKAKLVFSVIDKNKGEKKHLDDWLILINKNLPRPKKITKREATHMITKVARNNGLCIKREVISGNVFYKFNNL